jgi:hypothetical protein
MALLHPNQAQRAITAGRTAGRASVTRGKLVRGGVYLPRNRKRKTNEKDNN